MTGGNNLDDTSLGAVLKTALDAVVVMRPDGTVACWNRVAEATFGWTLEEARGRRMSELIVPERFREAHERGLAHYLATGEGSVLDRRIEIAALHKDGRELPVELSITATGDFGEPLFLGFLRDITQREEQQRQQKLLLGELNHRVKNIFAVTMGIAHQTARGTDSVPDFVRAFTARIKSMARAHDILTEQAWGQGSLGALAEALFEPFMTASDGRVAISGPEVMLSPRQFVTVSMILHELITNATKYGALSVPEGAIDLSWTMQDGAAEIVWTETGMDGLKEPAQPGFGTRMIELAARDLDGDGGKDWRSEGIRYRLRFRPD